MNTDLLCFLCGLPLLALWLGGVRRGVMIGLLFGLVRRDQTPGRFWPATLVYGVLVLGLVATPSLQWLGMRS